MCQNCPKSDRLFQIGVICGCCPNRAALANTIAQIGTQLGPIMVPGNWTPILPNSARFGPMFGQSVVQVSCMCACVDCDRGGSERLVRSARRRLSSRLEFTQQKGAPAYPSPRDGVVVGRRSCRARTRPLLWLGRWAPLPVSRRISAVDVCRAVAVLAPSVVSASDVIRLPNLPRQAPCGSRRVPVKSCDALPISERWSYEADNRSASDAGADGRTRGFEGLRRSPPGEDFGRRRPGFEGPRARGSCQSANASLGPAAIQGPASSASTSSGSGLTTQCQMPGAASSPWSSYSQGLLLAPASIRIRLGRVWSHVSRQMRSRGGFVYERVRKHNRKFRGKDQPSAVYTLESL